ncbi:hypothetical protein [Halarchaeum nitratireducens]|uniref:Uncharacterized protein n=1 Tax=Halarchaeum nitratireducens TaxID=489913 RepID=A0A830GF85_9EURY|nr:hypothetical protein [Halarchaeum nitratireducens]GGN26358.1 hypothetical protein GCM10009021_30820 [Halarchaeum nitratireducens]
MSIEINIFASQELYSNSQLQAPEVAKNYLTQALNDTEFGFDISTPNVQYDANDSDPNLDDFAATIQTEHPDLWAKDSNHLLVSGKADPIGAAGRRASYSDDGGVIAGMSSTTTQTEMYNTPEGAAIHGTLHEVGHELLYDSDVNDHKRGDNWVEYDPEYPTIGQYYVTPMLADHASKWSENGCQHDLVNPSDYSSFYRSMLWADCMTKKISPKDPV